MELVRSRRGLQKKFVASLLIVGFSPGIVALFATYLYSTQTLKNTIGDSFQQLAASTARRIEVMIDVPLCLSSRCGVWIRINWL